MVKEQKIGVLIVDNKEYISLTDLARYANPEDPSGVIRNWMSNKTRMIFIRFGKKLTILILIPWNPTELKMKKFHIIDLL